MKRNEWPDAGEFVVCTVTHVEDFAAFVELEEYEKEGFIPLREVASGWIKYIRNHVREGQKIVCKVLSVDRRRKRIDLSLKDVNEHQRRGKIKAWKNEKKAAMWLNHVSKVEKMSDTELEGLALKLLDAYGSTYAAFLAVADHGKEALVDAVGERYAARIYDVARENIKIPPVRVTGYLDLTCSSPDGIDVIKKTISEMMKSYEGEKIEISYVGAPRYRLQVEALDYKKAETLLRASANNAIEAIKKFNGTGEFYRHI
jgi:translation initiation factor 2 subunit 1